MNRWFPVRSGASIANPGSRWCHMSSALFTTPQKLPFISTATHCVLSSLHSGQFQLQNLRYEVVMIYWHHTRSIRVKVITIVTGGVKSRIARTPRALSKDSLYYPINAEYQRRLTHSQRAGVPNEQYAKQVVTEILYGRAPWRWLWPWSKPSHYIWAGGKVTAAWICNWGWTWYGLSDTVISWMFGINKLKRYVK